MYPAGAHEVPRWANKRTNTDNSCHNALLDGESRPIIAPRNRKLPQSTDTGATAYDSRLKQETRPMYTAKPRSKRKTMVVFLSRAIKNLRGAFLNYLSPAREGTTFLENEQQRREIADILYDEPGPWHEYGKLDSDIEDDKHNSHFSKKKSLRKWFKTRSERINTEHEMPCAVER
ncbi:hypothetical protein F5B22DRAFT_645874 [Xylaria bambusicola]|uniref:uncharacterized protein n=1 Tax=Xylaria bambusicola TaxID=326684 RepID=UPI002007ACF5|nr:uncharacterized protein F5B22DRAFT_645874 [Xylaria bambusicola]KAI0517240.1 hypothetical protein F5B22DRAFT_645874 [Xylaria bambusicola]